MNELFKLYSTYGGKQLYAVKDRIFKMSQRQKCVVKAQLVTNDEDWLTVPTNLESVPVEFKLKYKFGGIATITTDASKVT